MTAKSANLRRIVSCPVVIQLCLWVIVAAGKHIRIARRAAKDGRLAKDIIFVSFYDIAIEITQGRHGP